MAAPHPAPPDGTGPADQLALLVSAAVAAAAPHGRKVAAAVASAAIMACKRSAGATSDEALASSDDLSARLGIIEAQLRVQQKFNGASGGSTPALATAIKALRMLNGAGNVSKHNWTATDASIGSEVATNDKRGEVDAESGDGSDGGSRRAWRRRGRKASEPEKGPAGALGWLSCPAGLAPR